MAAIEMAQPRRSRRWGWLLACWSVLAVAGEGEYQDPGEWLRAMSEAMERLDYRATVAYSRDNRIQTLRLAHSVRDGVVHERLQALNDPLREVVREASKVTCYLPERRTIVVESRAQPNSLFGKWPVQWIEQAGLYRLSLGRRGHVAGRLAREVVIEPVDAHRYGRRIWIDMESKLPLKFELLDRGGNVLESFVVTALTVGHTAQQAMAAEGVPDRASEHWKLLDRKEVPADRRWQLTRLPQGFSEARRSRRVDPVDEAPVDHVLITDGLASVSVYIKRQGADDGFDPGSLRLGAVNVYNRRIDGYLITVLGDVPPETVRLIGDGVRAVAAAPAN